MIRLSTNISGEIEDMEERTRERINSGFSSMVSELRESAKRTAPVRTGRLRDSICSYVSGRLSGGVTYAAPYASFLVHGTGTFGPSRRATVIRQGREKALRFCGASDRKRVIGQKGIRPMDLSGKAVRKAALVRAFMRGFMKCNTC